MYESVACVGALRKVKKDFDSQLQSNKSILMKLNSFFWFCLDISQSSNKASSLHPCFASCKFACDVQTQKCVCLRGYEMKENSCRGKCIKLKHEVPVSKALRLHVDCHFICQWTSKECKPPISVDTGDDTDGTTLYAWKTEKYCFQTKCRLTTGALSTKNWLSSTISSRWRQFQTAIGSNRTFSVSGSFFLANRFECFIGIRGDTRFKEGGLIYLASLQPFVFFTGPSSFAVFVSNIWIPECNWGVIWERALPLI